MALVDVLGATVVQAFKFMSVIIRAHHIGCTLFQHTWLKYCVIGKWCTLETLCVICDCTMFFFVCSMDHEAALVQSFICNFLSQSKSDVCACVCSPPPVLTPHPLLLPFPTPIPFWWKEKKKRNRGSVVESIFFHATKCHTCKMPLCYKPTETPFSAQNTCGRNAHHHNPNMKACLNIRLSPLTLLCHLHHAKLLADREQTSQFKMWNVVCGQECLVLTHHPTEMYESVAL